MIEQELCLIRLPDFVTEKDFDWTVETASKKKKLDCFKTEFLTIDEGLCVQIMHLGPFDDEPDTVEIMKNYITGNGYENDFPTHGYIMIFFFLMRERPHLRNGKQ